MRAPLFPAAVIGALLSQDAVDRLRQRKIAVPASAGNEKSPFSRAKVNSGARPHPARLPIKPGKCGTMTHDYKRHGTTTLFAALSTLDGIVLGRCMQRHRHQKFIRFLNAVERAVHSRQATPQLADLGTLTRSLDRVSRRTGSRSHIVPHQGRAGGRQGSWAAVGRLQRVRAHRRRPCRQRRRPATQGPRTGR